jgi:hypothetical protein
MPQVDPDATGGRGRPGGSLGEAIDKGPQLPALGQRSYQ